MVEPLDNYEPLYEALRATGRILYDEVSAWWSAPRPMPPRPEQPPQPQQPRDQPPQPQRPHDHPPQAAIEQDQQLNALINSTDQTDRRAGTNIANMLRSPDATIREDGRRLRALLNEGDAARRADMRLIAANIDDPQRMRQMLFLLADPQQAAFARHMTRHLGNDQGRAQVNFVLDAMAGRVPAGANPQRREEWPNEAAALLGLGWLTTLRNLFRRRQALTSDLVPHIGDRRFNVPMGGEVTLRRTGESLSFFDGPTQPSSSDVAVLRRTENGWVVLAIGEGFYHRPAGANEYRLVPPGTTVAFGPNDSVRLGPENSTHVLTFRPETAPAPAPEPGQMQMRVRSEGRLRHVDLVRPDGTTDRVTLHAAGGFLQAEATGSVQSHLKLHIAVLNAADLARLQPHVIDAIRNDPVLRRLVTAWKTLDPAYATGETARAHGVAPTGEGQGAKGFTIYCANAEDAFLIQERLSQILAERGLSLPQTPNNNNVDRLDARTNRVGIVREVWPLTSDINGREGFLLDTELTRRVNEHFRVAGGQQLTTQQLRQLESDLGIKRNTIAYDNRGRLMMRSTYDRDIAHNGGAYANESGAITPEGLTDRPALYRLYQRFNLDPTDFARAIADSTAVRPSGVTPENLQRAFTEIADRLSSDPFLRNSALAEFQRRVDLLQTQLRGTTDAAARGTAVNTAVQHMIRDMAPTLGDAMVTRLRGVSIVAAPELDLNGAPQARHIFRNSEGRIVRPTYIDGTNAVIRETNFLGIPVERRVPLSQLTLEVQVPASAISANLTTEAGAAQFRRMLANVYEQIDRAHRWGTLSAREARDPQIVHNSGRTGDVIAEYLNREVQANANPHTRRSADFNGLSPEALNRAAESLVAAFDARPITTGLMSDAALQYFIGRFRNRTNEIFSQPGATARATEIQNLVREMVQRPGMQIGIDPSRIIVETGSSIEGNGQQLIRHKGGAGQPAVEGVLVGRQGGNVQIRLPGGEVITRPVSEVSLVTRLPESQLLHASGTTGEGVTPHTSAAAHEVASTVYRFLAQADAVLNGRAPAGTAVSDIGRLSEVVARRVQFELNSHRLTPNHNLGAVQLAQVDVARVVNTPQPRGVIHATTENGVVRYELVDGNTRRALTQEEKERVERQMQEYCERVYAESMRSLEQRANDRNLSQPERDQAQLALDAIREDLRLYRESPQRRAAVHEALPRNVAAGGNSVWRQRFGTGAGVLSSGVIIYILAETAAGMAQRGNNGGGGGGLQMVPVR